MAKLVPVMLLDADWERLAARRERNGRATVKAEAKAIILAALQADLDGERIPDPGSREAYARAGVDPLAIEARDLRERLGKLPANSPEFAAAMARLTEIEVPIVDPLACTECQGLCGGAAPDCEACRNTGDVRVQNAVHTMGPDEVDEVLGKDGA